MTYITKTKVDSNVYHVLKVAARKYIPESEIRRHMKYGSSEEEARTDLAMKYTGAVTIDDLLDTMPIGVLQKAVQERRRQTLGEYIYPQPPLAPGQ